MFPPVETHSLIGTRIKQMLRHVKTRRQPISRGMSSLVVLPDKVVAMESIRNKLCEFTEDGKTRSHVIGTDTLEIDTDGNLCCDASGRHMRVQHKAWTFGSKGVGVVVATKTSILSRPFLNDAGVLFVCDFGFEMKIRRYHTSDLSRCEETSVLPPLASQVVPTFDPRGQLVALVWNYKQDQTWLCAVDTGGDAPGFRGLCQIATSAAFHSVKVLHDAVVVANIDSVTIYCRWTGRTLQSFERAFLAKSHKLVKNQFAIWYDDKPVEEWRLVSRAAQFVYGMTFCVESCVYKASKSPLFEIQLVRALMVAAGVIGS